MPVEFQVLTCDPVLLEKARRIAYDFIQPYLGQEVLGIVFLGAIVRGYFDSHADIDIAIFKRRGVPLPLDKKFFKVEGIEVQAWLSDYEDDLAVEWDMPRRWTYSQCQVVHDPTGAITRLIANKVPLKDEEARWLMMSGLTLSEWYINRLTMLWIDRGDMISAQHMFDQGLLYFFDMLFGLNGELVADMKWRIYCVKQLPRLPVRFRERLQEVMLLHAFTVEELERRKAAFMHMWREMLPVVETEVGLTLAQMEELV